MAARCAPASAEPAAASTGAAAATGEDEAGEGEGKAAAAPAAPPAPPPPAEEGWVAAVALGDLPKGKRKVLTVGGYSMMLLWYRSDIYAVESRSPAEGAYSEGMVNAKLTQDGAIICPSTDSVMDLKTGAIREWYPNNLMLAKLTPVCRPMDTFPVTVAGEAVYVQVPVGDDGVVRTGTTGGKGTSAEEDNVYGIEPKMYLEGEDPMTGSALDERVAAPSIDATQLTVGVVAVALLGTAGTGYTLVVMNSIKALAAFWAVLMVATAAVVVKTTDQDFLEEDQ